MNLTEAKKPLVVQFRIPTGVPFEYVTEGWQKYAAINQEAMVSNAKFLFEANVAQDEELHYTSPAEADMLQNQDVPSERTIIGTVITPMRPVSIQKIFTRLQLPEKQKAEIPVANYTSNSEAKPIIRHQTKRFVIIASQDPTTLQGAFEFIPIKDLPKGTYIAGLKHLSFPKMIEMLQKAGASRKAILEALAAVPPTNHINHDALWKSKGGRPNSKIEMKNRSQSYKLHATPREIAKNKAY